MKKWIAGISAAVLAFTGVASAVPGAVVTAADSNSKYNYGEALQKSMFFYEVQQSGKKPDWNEVSWRSDCMTNDYVTGGWFDAGDHLKFTLTNAYSAALLGWGLLNYGDGVEKAGQRTMYENNLQFALDYLVGCDQGDNIVYMIGEGSFDHVWWGSAEVYMDKYELMKGETQRPYYTCEDSCIEADMAAALATGYLNFKDSQPEKAKEYLEHAVDLFDRADKLRSIGDDPEEQSYYKITTFYDDLFYAANWLYMATGEQKYLDLAKYFIDERGTKPYYYDIERGLTCPEGEERYSYNQANRPVRQQDEVQGHSVRAVYLYSGMADVARATQDESLLKACETLWNNMVHQKMYVTGGIGATHIGEAFSFNYDLPNDTAYAETCASIGLVFFARRMLEIQAKAEYADVMELALYNGVLSGMALDGKSFFYVNPLEVLPEACHKDERKFHVKPIRQKWFGCACCPPNLARTVSSVASYAYTENDTTLFVHLYMGGTVEGEKVKASITSEFPWDGHVSVTCESDTKEPYTFAFRIPGWCASYEKEIPKGAEVEEKDGYLYVTKVWAKGETIRLNFPMEIQLLASNPLVREDAGRVAVKRGPVVYCMEEADNGKNLHLTKLCVNGEKTAEAADELGEHFVCVTAEGRRMKLGELQSGGKSEAKRS